MSQDFTFSIKRICFDEHYHPSDNTRITTNFANLARGEKRQQNLRNALAMINNRFNALANWDNPHGDRYAVQLDIISVDLDIEGQGQAFPAIEILKTNVLDRSNNQVIDGIVGNNFSSYVRDYDFSVLLPEHNQHQAKFSVPENFGELHGKLFQHFVHSDVYKQHFAKPPVICLSVSDSKTYHRTENRHPVLGVEYRPNESSLTEHYFKRMGLQVRYFMPHQCHTALAITGAVGLATAAVTPGTLAHTLVGCLSVPGSITLEHPSGALEVGLSRSSQDAPVVASVVRTARRLFEGRVFATTPALAVAGSTQARQWTSAA